MRTRVDDTIRTDGLARSDARRTTRSSLIAVLVVALSVVGVAAAPASGAAISNGRAKVQFIQDEVAQYNAIGNFVGKLEKLTNSSTDAQILAVSKPLGHSLKAFQEAIGRQSWPAKAGSQVPDLATATSQASAVLLTSESNSATWRTAIVNDINNWTAAVDTMDKDLGLKSISNSQYVDACQADGATVATAMAAFHAETHGVKPTIALLTGKKYGGPYLENWPHNKPHYTYTLSASGRLFLAAPSSAKPVLYRGPNGCYPSFE